MSDVPVEPKRSKAPFVLGGCALSLVLLVAALAYGWHRWDLYDQEQARLADEARAAEAKETFDPALKHLSEGIAAGQPVDIDKTIRVVQGLDRAMKEKPDVHQFLDEVAHEDLRGVAPDVLIARRRILEVLFELYAKQEEAEDKQAAYEFTGELVLSTLSLVSVSGDVSMVNPEGQFSVDREQARKLLADLKEKQEDRARLAEDIDALQGQLFTALMDYSTTYYKHVEAWDKLCSLRDRAYLGVHARDWETVKSSSEAAIAMSPSEKEAHLLLAMALIEGGNPEENDRAIAVLDDYIGAHPDSSAPAFLLRGVAKDRIGDKAGAQLDLQQSAAYYPKQSEKLNEMLDPYKMRTYLRKSREGGYIVEQYASTMTGAGYFSPDLQLARTAFESGDFITGKGKVMDHFARRRAQGQWDYILSDIQFSHELLGTDFQAIFPEESWLDLQVSPTMFGGSVNVAVNNRSQRALHNATLVLAVRFTDMHPADYVAFAAGNTQPAVMPHDVTSFGTVELGADVGGVKKGVADVVTQRAVLVADEAVLWVDMDDYKIAEAKEFHDAKLRKEPLPEQRSPTYQKLSRSLDTMGDAIRSDSAASVESRYGKDDLVLRLPSRLSVLRPVFTLEYEGKQFKASNNVIDGDDIVLTFSGLANFDDAGTTPGEAKLHLGSVFGEIDAVFAKGADGWGLKNVEFPGR